MHTDVLDKVSVLESTFNAFYRTIVVTGAHPVLEPL